MLLQLLWMIVTSQDVNGEILRLSCKTFANFSVVLEDRSLRAAFRTFDSLDEYTCKFECIKEQLCKSINVNEELGACQLNNKSAQDPNDGIETQAAAGWTYYSTRYDELHVGQLCQSEHPCRTGEKCIDTCTCPGYKCLDFDECKAQTHRCHQKATCTNMYGSYSCQCNVGFRGDGRSCAENVALKKPAAQSSTYINSEGIFNASFGNDGSLSGLRAATLIENYPWWRVDLVEQRAVKMIAILGPLKFYNINPLNVSVGDDSSNGGRNNRRCIKDGNVSITISNFSCPTVLFGRYVSVFVNRKSRIAFTELEVYEGRNIAYKRPSSSSSVLTTYYTGYTLYASLGNDGNTTGKWQGCSITHLEKIPWWQVDLTKQAAVSSVRIKSGHNWAPLWINPFNVSVGDDSSNGGQNNALCVENGIVNAGEFKYFYCPTGLHGRYVTVFVNRLLRLLICEIEVYESLIGTY